MKIYKISDNRFAIGMFGQPATFVVDVVGRPGHGGKIKGVRGIKPVLDSRFPAITKGVNKQVIEYLQERV